MKRVILLSLSILLISLAYSFAEVPCKINYQGRLIKDNVPVDGTKTMVFSIYAGATGGSPIWSSGDVSVEVHNGLFRYVIGTDGGDLSSIDWTAGQTLYLQVIVDGETLTPREELSAYPYAINSHLLEGEAKEYFINTSADTQTKQGNLNIMGNVGIGTTSPAQKLHVAGNLRVDGAIVAPEGTLRDDGGGWIRTYGSTGWYSQSHGGGWYMIDSSWIRSYGNKNILHNTGIMRTDGTFQVGPSGNRFLVKTDGNVGIGTTEPARTLHIAGSDGMRLEVSALPDPAGAGDIVIDSDDNTLKWHDGSDWQPARLKTWDSEWFPCTTGGTYSKTHNLGSKYLMIQVLWAPNSAGSPNENQIYAIDHSRSEPHEHGAWIKEITNETLTVQAGGSATALSVNNDGNHTMQTGGWYRVLAIRIN